MTDTRLKELAAKLKTLLDDKIMPEADRYYELKTYNQLTPTEKSRGQAANQTAALLKGVLFVRNSRRQVRRRDNRAFCEFSGAAGGGT